ncbi:MAG: nucleotidyl transferase AbiEii/AbiGii toxin family protein, partial [bacterium]|nr:nucleotidyl transferase AbiEii/AbiGii toxin family protein [bacterium]
DTRPPPDARLETKILQKEFIFSVVHHDLPSLFAGKIMAFLFRNYTKGRDVYDLLWYATRKTPINRNFLESSLAQTIGQTTIWSEKELVEKMTQKINSLDMAVVLRDTLPFMDHPEEKRFFKKELLIQAVQDLRYREL